MTREQHLLEACQQAAEIHRLAKRAVRRAQEESRRLGVANVYSRNGRLYYDSAQVTAGGQDTGDTDWRSPPHPILSSSTGNL